jgi:hypothetical protein
VDIIYIALAKLDNPVLFAGSHLCIIFRLQLTKIAPECRVSIHKQ